MGILLPPPLPCWVLGPLQVTAESRPPSSPLPDTNSSFKVSGSDWLLLNLNVSGYFRVNYNQENWNQLLQQLSSNHLVRGTGGGRLFPAPRARATR